MAERESFSEGSQNQSQEIGYFSSFKNIISWKFLDHLLSLVSALQFDVHLA
jgi:hypothetical protein